VVEIAGNVKIRFDLPEAVEYHFLEFTIPIVPGRYRIGRLVLRGTMVADLSRRILQVHDRLLPEDASHQLRYASDFGRPSFEFDARGLDRSSALPDGPASVEVEICREDAVASFEALLVDHVESLSSSLRQLSRETNEVASGHGQQLRRQEERLAIVDRTLVARADELASAQLRLGEQIRQLHEQFVSMNASHSKGITAALQIVQQTHEQVGQVRFAIENVFWRRWLRYLRGVRR
jgi:hypothetical protein